MAVQIPAYMGKLGLPAIRDRQITSKIFNDIEQVLGGGDLLVTAAGGMVVSTAKGHCVVQGDVATNDGMYEAFNDAAVTKTMTADASNPRVNRISLQIFDSEAVGSGSDLGDIIVTPGTPQSGASLTNVGSWPALPASAIPLAAVRVGAAASSVATSDILDLRPRMSGKSVVAASESIPTGAGAPTFASLATMPTPDRVSNIVVPTDAIVLVAFSARSLITPNGTAGTIFAGDLAINGSQVQSQNSPPAFTTSMLTVSATGSSARGGWLVNANYAALINQGDSVAASLPAEPSPVVWAPTYLPLRLPAGTYTFEYRFYRNTTVSSAGILQDRRLAVRTVPHPS